MTRTRAAKRTGTKPTEIEALRAEVQELRRRVELLEVQRYVPPPQFPVPYMPSYPSYPYQPFTIPTGEPRHTK